MCTKRESIWSLQLLKSQKNKTPMALDVVLLEESPTSFLRNNNHLQITVRQKTHSTTLKRRQRAEGQFLRNPSRDSVCRGEIQDLY
jgi:hypothetical protein